MLDEFPDKALADAIQKLLIQSNELVKRSNEINAYSAWLSSNFRRLLLESEQMCQWASQVAQGSKREWPLRRSHFS